MSEYLKAIFSMCEGISLAYIVLGGAFLCFLLLLVLNYYLLRSDRLAFLLSWARFGLLSGFVYIALKFGLEFRGEISLKILSVLISAWLELSNLWLEAYSYSRRNILPFSGFVECENAWRPDREYYDLKQTIKESGFEKLKSFRARNYLSLATLFYNEREDIALLVQFSLRGNRLRSFYYFVSKREDDSYLIFTNNFRQDMLFLRGKYSMYYRVFATFKSLLGKHKARMEYENYVDFRQESENLPHLLYNDNMQAGLEMNVYSKNRDRGQLLTSEGKFQFCKRLIIKNYFRI